MRLWHIALLDVLPREQLVAQWRELSSIAGTIQKRGTPNHILVNFVITYPFSHLISYAYYVRQEMSARGYKTMDSVYNKILSLDRDCSLLPKERVFDSKMNDTYLKICAYNLYEKYLCGQEMSTETLERLRGIIRKNDF